MNALSKIFTVGLLFLGVLTFARAQEQAATSPRRLTLQEAVQLALKHNHVVRMAGFQVEAKQHAKDVAKSGYFPTIKNDSSVVKLTDTQFIQIAAGSLGTAAGTAIPTTPVTLNQGGRTVETSRTGLTQPLTQLYTRVKPQNDAASAELGATRANAHETENEVALQVHELYYRVLITQLHHSATEARIKAAQDLLSERTEQVKYGSALDEDVIESRAQSLQAKQELLTTELQLSDLTMQLDDVTGLPLNTQLELDPSVPGVHDTCELGECIKVALQSHPEIVAAREELRKATAGLQLSKADYVPDVTAFARYDYQNQVPFLARNFGVFGLELTYDLFDGGRRRAAVHESDAEVAEAKENLARVTEDVELKLQIAYNKLQRTKEMVQVSEELYALRAESSRVSAQQLQKGEALQSQAQSAVAQEFDAKTTLLQSQLDYIQARDQVIQAMGITPE
ncbi:MAG: TolC family protein [Candidatus Acidiferrales bacterium]|jgi:outer membrane protein TolC